MEIVITNNSFSNLSSEAVYYIIKLKSVVTYDNVNFELFLLSRAESIVIVEKWVCIEGGRHGISKTQQAAVVKFNI